MRVMVAQACSVLMLAVLQGSVAGRGMPLDLRMLSLVSPQSQIVAGVTATPRTRRQGSFLLFTIANRIDYEDLLALAASDASLQIDRLILTATAGASNADAEHSVIARGRLRPDRIARSGEYPSGVQEYRGIVTLGVRPFARERAYFRRDRLLAFIGSDLVIFGTPSCVREEIDRFLDGAVAEPSLVRRISLLNGEDDSWYLVRSPGRQAEFSSLLKSLDEALSGVGSGEGLLFGIHFGKQVEFDYITEYGSDISRTPALQVAMSRSFRGEADGMEASVRVVRVGRRRFENWLRQVERR
ncbi:hypothetical protein [Occallatibacter savannae]|uniref:hypothetical protein n=1 Tax=Occallatibacter savannae TaxID=1002691 RepID=UPI000D69B53C|nr:hypothetical protein [Occallatibacter savannae]